jgi:hypothetical protein
MLSVGANVFTNVGPGAIRNIELYVTPTSLEAGASAELHIPAYFGLQLPIVLGGAGEGLVCDVGQPPTSFYVAAWVGGIGTGRASLLADFTTRITFGVTVNPLLILVSPLQAVTPQFFSSRTTLDIGGVIEYMVNLFGSGSVAGREFCLITRTLKKGSAGKAVKLTSDLDIDLTGRSGSIASGDIHATPMPIADLMSAVAYDTPPPLCPQAIPFLLTLTGSGAGIVPSLPISPPGTPPIAPPFGPPSVSPPGLPSAPAAKPTFTCPVPPKKRAQQAPTGSYDDPIEMRWGKPEASYPPAIQLLGGRYGRKTPKKLLISKREIGVPGTWPTVGTRLKKNKTPRGDVDKEFKKNLVEEGYDGFEPPVSHSPDHVLDLFFGGADHFKNLWPLDKDVNASAGLYQQIQKVKFNYPSDPETEPPREDILNKVADLGVWFVIKWESEAPH